MKILIADDHPFTLQGTKSYVESYGYTDIDACSNGTAALNLLKLNTHDIAILDINMPGLDGLDLAKAVYENGWKTKVILLTMHKEMTIYKKAQEYKIFGYILKENAHPELQKCLKQIIANQPYISVKLEDDLAHGNSKATALLNKLTLSERKILELIKLQKTSKQIAELLFLSERTVEGHRSNIIEKLELPKEKNALLIWALQHSKS